MLYNLVNPILKKLDPELANRAALMCLRSLGLKEAAKPRFPSLEQRIWGHDFATPVGLAAGFDKNAFAIAGHFHLGFGFVELGTVTPQPQPGNPKPRIHRDEGAEAIINSLGFPSAGHAAVGRRLGRFLLNASEHWGIVGINIGANAPITNPAEDYKLGMQAMGGLAHYICVNVSSPNTKGLRGLLQIDELSKILDAVVAERELIPDKLPAIVLKISPDMAMEDVEPLSKLLIEKGINGLVISNTTTERPDVLAEKSKSLKGGASGPFLAARTTDLIRAFYPLLKDKVMIIGCGGVNDGASAYAKIKAGAHLIQLYTALVYKGPTVVNKINKELVDLIKKDGYTSISDAVGADHAQTAGSMAHG